MTDSIVVGLVAVALLLLLSGLVDIARNGRPFDPRMLSRTHRQHLGATNHSPVTILVLAVAAVLLAGTGTISVVTRADGSPAVRIDTTPVEQLLGAAP